MCMANLGDSGGRLAARAAPDDREVDETGLVARGRGDDRLDAEYRLGVERLQRAAALAGGVAVLVAGGERVAAGAVPGVDVAHEPGPLERLEVPVDRAEVRRGQPPAQAAGDLLGADRAVGGEQRLDDGAPRGGDPEAAGAQGRQGAGG